MTEKVQLALVGLAGVIVVQGASFLTLYIKLRGVEKNVNGINTHLQARNEEQIAEIDAAHNRAEHAEGYIEGSEKNK